MDVAKNALKALQGLKFNSGPCRADLAALSAKAGTTIDAAAIEGWVSEILDKGTLFDGLSSKTVWSVADFGSTLTYGSSPPPTWTVGMEFTKQFPGTLALSQKTGSAIWVLSGAWQFFTSAGAEGTMIHEIIHKFGLSDGAMGEALGVDVSGNNSARPSTKLKQDCVDQPTRHTGRDSSIGKIRLR